MKWWPWYKKPAVEHHYSSLCDHPDVYVPECEARKVDETPLTSITSTDDALDELIEEILPWNDVDEVGTIDLSNDDIIVFKVPHLSAQRKTSMTKYLKGVLGKKKFIIIDATVDVEIIKEI